VPESGPNMYKGLFRIFQSLFKYEKSDQSGHSVNNYTLNVLKIIGDIKKNREFYQTRGIYFHLRKEGLEPSRLSAPPPQDGASASSATSAKELAYLPESPGVATGGVVVPCWVSPGRVDDGVEIGCEVFVLRFSMTPEFVPPPRM
jgi:hypothetical protein